MMIRINVLFTIYNYNCLGVFFIKNNILSYETDNAIMNRNKYTVPNRKKKDILLLHLQKQNLFHIPFNYILHSIFFSIETVNGIYNIESNHDKHLYFVSYFAIYQNLLLRSCIPKDPV